jgi:hypothetical protein
MHKSRLAVVSKTAFIFYGRPIMPCLNELKHNFFDMNLHAVGNIDN